MMKPNCFILSILCFATCFFSMPLLQAQEAKMLFMNMPDSLIPLLTKVNRADCVDFLESKMKAQVSNRFGTRSEMLELSKDYIRVQLTEQTSWQMKLLSLNDTAKVVCTISTTCGPACDSTIGFYTTDWKPLPTSSFLTLPVMDDFWETPESTAVPDFEIARRSADMLLMKADLDQANTSLTISLATIDYLSKETAEKLVPFLRRALIYQWKNGSFQKEPVATPSF